MDFTTRPATDPTPLFELFRGSYATELLVAAVAHFGVFARLADAPKTAADLGGELGLATRAGNVLFTALRAMGTLTLEATGRLALTPMAREHLLPDGQFYVGDYCGLAGAASGVLALVERLRTNQPAGANFNQVQISWRL